VLAASAGKEHAMKKSSPEDDSTGFVYAKWITLRNGKRLYAATVGLKAFRFKPRRK
jgi:hypothetical protein